MARVVYERLIEDQALAAGGSVQSSNIDVSGARSVNILLRISSDDARVEWSIYFASLGETRFHLPAAYGKFAPFFQPISIPVYGPRLTVMIQNQGTRESRCEGRVYFIREIE